MATIHFHQNTTATPDEFIAGLTDFGAGPVRAVSRTAPTATSKSTVQGPRGPMSPKARAASGNA